MTPSATRQLARRAARHYRSAGIYMRYHTRGKLAGDPMFRALLSPGLIPDQARLLDLGCGAGLLVAWLAAAQEALAAGEWPAETPPPRPASYLGLELMERDVRLARRVVAAWPGAHVAQDDLRTARLPESDVIFLLDVLHYIEPESQDALLGRVASALAPGGRLILRVGDAGAGRRFRFTMAVDRLVCRWRGLRLPALYGRPLVEWQNRLVQLGFRVECRAMSEGTPFANVLLIAHRP